MSTIATPTSGFVRIKQARHGLTVYNINDIYIGKSFDLYGEFSEGEVELFRQVLRPGDFVIEVGANIGAHTVAIAQIVGPTGAVFALEPQRIPFQMLCSNVTLNGLTNVWAFNAAAGETPGQIAVPEANPNVAGNFGGVALDQGIPGNPVTLMRVDGIGVPKCRMIKVDVEGMELTVLKGCSGLIEKFHPLLYVENDRKERMADLIRYIDSIGYHMYWHLPPLFNPDNFEKRAENVFGNIASWNMLCVPAAASASIQGMTRVEVPAPGVSLSSTSTPK